MRNSETRIALNTKSTRKADNAIGLVRRLMGWGAGIAATAALALAPIQAQAQEVETFDTDVAFEAYQANGDTAQAESGIDADLVNPALRSGNPDAALPSLPEQPRGPVRVQPQSGPATVITQGGFDDESSDYSDCRADSGANSQAGEAVPMWSDPEPGEQVASAANSANALPADANSGTYGEDDLIGAAEGVFGKGAEGLAGMIEDLLRKQGEPNGYIVGREGGGAFIFGVRYGSGTLHHKVEGERKVYWTGPSLGFDAGANAGNTFVLVYNLYDSEDLFKRYPAGEGQAYLVGGLHASYMRRGDVVLIPIRVGAGLRLGVNAGYMRFSKKQRWLPF